MDEQAGKGDDMLHERELGEPELRCTLRRGQVLYIPRGAPHVARTDGSPSSSLHLTIAIPTADLSWGGFLMQAAAAVSGVSKWMALRPREVELDFRRSLPLGPLPPPLPLPPLDAGDEPAAAAAARPPPPASAGVEACSMATYMALHTTVHDVTYAESRRVMRNKLLSKARARAEALALVQRQMASHGAPAPLRPADLMRKLVAVELLDEGRVVQTRPEEGSGKRLLHTFLPTELLPAVTTFAAIPCGQTFTLSELGAHDGLLLACAARRLMALQAVRKE